MMLADASGSPLKAMLAGARKPLLGIAALSAVINILVLGGSIYMMLVYDRVLPSHSYPTLVGLLVLVLIAYSSQAGFEALRSNMLGEVAAEIGNRLRPRVARAAHQHAIDHPVESSTQSPLRDLDQLQNFIAGTGPAALLDLPWIVFFLIVLSLLHIWLGVTALVGALLLVGLTRLTDRINRDAVQQLSSLGLRRFRMQESQRIHAELIRALGMRDRTIAIAQEAGVEFVSTQRELNEKNVLLSVTGRSTRMVLQSLILTVGALLVLSGEATGGVIFASSVLAGRALAPVDQAIAQWRNLIAARSAWHRLDRLLSVTPEQQERLLLPLPSRQLSVENVTVCPPGTQRPSIAQIAFTLSAGDVLAVIGPSAAGKSSLVRTIVGVWTPVSGRVRLDQAAMDQWDADDIGRALGYLPQSVELFDGSIAYNIARCDVSATPESIIAAAQAAGVHEMILALPGGYQFEVGDGGTNLSAGQRQRIALARALFGNPFLIVLDEPNSNLDAAGEAALVNAITLARTRGAIVIVVAHRKQILDSVSHLLVLEGGRVREFGGRDEVIMRMSLANNTGVTSMASANVG